MLSIAISYMARHLQDVWNREGGQGLVEYALILSLVSIAALVVLGVLGVDVTVVLDRVENALDGNNNPDPVRP
jgi:Flp pilus assembly pilin Flp